MKKGLSVLVVLIIILSVLLVSGGVYLGWRYYSQNSSNINKAPSPVIEPNNVINPSEKLLSKIQVGSLTIGNLSALQKAADQGELVSYLDPAEVARIEGMKYGFSSQDIYTFKGKQYAEMAGTYLATVEIKHGSDVYVVKLIKPEKQGDAGIWAINSITKK